MQCTQGCAANDTVCNQTCLANNEGAISEAALLNDCGGSTCALDCPDSTALDICTKCLFTNCSTAMNACLSNPECSALVQCAQDCFGDAFCQLGCYDDHPDGQNDADAVTSCLQNSCSGQCG